MLITKNDNAIKQLTGHLTQIKRHWCNDVNFTLLSAELPTSSSFLFRGNGCWLFNPITRDWWHQVQSCADLSRKPTTGISWDEEQWGQRSSVWQGDRTRGRSTFDELLGANTFLCLWRPRHSKGKRIFFYILAAIVAHLPLFLKWTHVGSSSTMKKSICTITQLGLLTVRMARDMSDKEILKMELDQLKKEVNTPRTPVSF